MLENVVALPSSVQTLVLCEDGEICTSQMGTVNKHGEHGEKPMEFNHYDNFFLFNEGNLKCSKTERAKKDKLSSASIVTSVFQENVGLVHMKGLTRTKNLLHATTVARGSLPREVSTSMQKLTQERSPSSVGIVTSVLVTKDI